MPALEMPFGAEGWNPARLGDLSGRAFVVTGTTTGCGFQCAKLLLSKGAQVIMLNRSAERSAAAVEMLKAGGGDVSSVLMDLADLSSVRKAATQVLDKLEGATLQAVICNAAIAQVASRQLTVDSIEQALLPQIRAIQSVVDAIEAKRNQIHNFLVLGVYADLEGAQTFEDVDNI